MSESKQDELQALWRQMAQRNEWSLVTDEAAFLDQVAAELSQLEGDYRSQHPRIAIQRTYSTVLYRGIQACSDQAGKELWLYIFRLSLSNGWSKADAGEVAQEAVAQILEQFPKLKTPQSLMVWSIMILRTVWRDYAKRTRRAVMTEQLLEDILYPVQMEAEVEHNLLMETLVPHIRHQLPNPLEQTVFLRWLFLGGQPHEIADDLGLPLQHIRIAKFRAIERLKRAKDFCNMLRSLIDADDRLDVDMYDNPQPKSP